MVTGTKQHLVRIGKGEHGSLDYLLQRERRSKRRVKKPRNECPLLRGKPDSEKGASQHERKSGKNESRLK